MHICLYVPVRLPGELRSSPEIRGVRGVLLCFITLMAVGVACCTGAGMICTAGEYQETVLPRRPTHAPFIEKLKCCLEKQTAL